MSVSKDFILRIKGSAPTDQSKLRAEMYYNLLDAHIRLTQYLNKVDSFTYNSLNLEEYKSERYTEQPQYMIDLQKFIKGIFADGEENDVVAEEDGQYYQVSPPKDGKKKKKKRSS